MRGGSTKRSRRRNKRDRPAPEGREAPSGLEQTRFIADAMLGSLARKLRALGFDTVYYRTGDDSGLLRLASTSGRVVLTSDRALAHKAIAGGAKAILLTGVNDRQRVRSLVTEAKRSTVPLVSGDSLCSICGGKLETLRKGDVAGMVPQTVEKRHRLFYRCLSCGQTYWRGSHWKELRYLARLLEET